MCKRIILTLLTIVFLLILAPVFAFSMVAPWAVKTILIWWSGIVAILAAIGGAISLWVFMESRS